MRDKIFLLTLGRETTIWEIARKIQDKSDKEITTSEMGPFYNCKKELLDKKLLIEKPRKGRIRPITANLPNYFEYVFSTREEVKLSDYVFVKKKMLPLFEKYVPKIVDWFLFESGLEDAEGIDITMPFVFFSLLCVVSCEQSSLAKQFEDAHERLRDTWPLVKTLRSFSELQLPTLEEVDQSVEVAKPTILYAIKSLLDKFSKKERKELCMTRFLNRRKIRRFLLLLVAISPEDLVKGVMIKALQDLGFDAN